MAPPPRASHTASHTENSAMSETKPTPAPAEIVVSDEAAPPPPPKQPPGEIGGPRGPEPTRFGDWECKGRCSDF